MTPSLYHVYRGTATRPTEVPALNGEERQALKKTYEVRYRQFARGRRSIKTITVPAPNAENAKKHFEATIQLMKYFKRVQPANPATRNRRIERSEPKTYIDVTTPEVREMEQLNRKVDLVGQAIVAVLIPVGALALVYNIVRWLCGF